MQQLRTPDHVTRPLDVVQQAAELGLLTGTCAVDFYFSPSCPICAFSLSRSNCRRSHPVDPSLSLHTTFYPIYLCIIRPIFVSTRLLSTIYYLLSTTYYLLPTIYCLVPSLSNIPQPSPELHSAPSPELFAPRLRSCSRLLPACNALLSVPPSGLPAPPFSTLTAS